MALPRIRHDSVSKTLNEKKLTYQYTHDMKPTVFLFVYFSAALDLRLLQLGFLAVRTGYSSDLGFLIVVASLVTESSLWALGVQ